ncbi:CO(2)-response secreted protease-like [Panicum miliaceum]|uniref:CO(2)-response secreted protease-like n=1 Tax=Panicum miliaceum TaxID=4540 RepID=A0A3L6QVS6_PANMI|nr:CO(2)-response secreted protease-like [Panicum miliaceum]
MAAIWLLLACLIAAASLAGAGDGGSRSQVYVVYMGAVPARTSPNLLLESHLRLVGTVLKRGQRADSVVVRQYRHGFSGFAARLSKDQAAALRRRPGVVSVFADPVYQLHTTRSWDFLQQAAVKIDAGDPSSSSSPAAATADTIIGLLDSGIWPESPSFSDAGFGHVPTRWKGVCMTGDDFNSSSCNKKLIGARYYDMDDVRGPSQSGGGGSPRDDVGHGTHTSSTAAGSAVAGASYYGLAPGTAKGGSAASRVAMYRVCSEEGCAGSAILAGFDDAVADGVDVLSVSLGASPYFRPDFSADPIAIGSFHAVAKGVTVVCSAGNSGPAAATVVNAAPWILTVAATTIDRDFESDVVLGGNNSAVRGGAINFSNLDKSPKYPLITGAAAKSSSVSDAASASHCEPGTLDSGKVQGKIVLCSHSQGDTSKQVKADELKSAGAVGCIFVNDAEVAVATTYLDFPATEVTSASAAAIRKYIASTR